MCIIWFLYTMLVSYSGGFLGLAWGCKRKVMLASTWEVWMVVDDEGIGSYLYPGSGGPHQMSWTSPPDQVEHKLILHYYIPPPKLVLVWTLGPSQLQLSVQTIINYTYRGLASFLCPVANNVIIIGWISTLLRENFTSVVSCPCSFSLIDQTKVLYICSVPR